MQSYNFDTYIERNGTNCLKFDGKKRYFGTDDVQPLWVADMDFKTPDFIMDTIKKRCTHEILAYNLKSKGFYDAATGWLAKRFNWNISDDDISFTPGIVSALNFAVLAFTNPGDKVIIQSPVYAPFYTCVKDHDRKLAINPLKLVNGKYEMDLEHFESLIDKNTKLFILCSPHNPVGRVWTKEELKAVGEICLKHGIIILSDEIHSDLIFKPNVHTPIAHISEELANVTVTLMAPSKTFNIAGLSSSMAIITNPELQKRFNHLPNACHLGSGNIFGLTAFEAAYKNGETWLSQLLDYLWNTVQYTDSFLKENLPTVKLVKPEGMFLLWLDFSGTGLNDFEIRRRLIENAKVGFNHGPDFGEDGKGFQRMNIGTPLKNVHEALIKVAKAFK
ncbi:MAG TPA: PatB family C-S lyase [Bacteroidales bacterium]|nr:PatB family C-S lyase [Bacteroidales bacterium]